MQGWCSEEKAEMFMDLVLRENLKVCVEIGVFGGASALPIATALKLQGGEGVIYCVDPWDSEEASRHFDPIKDKENYTYWSRIDFSRIYRGFINTVNVWQLEDQCVVIQADSALAAEDIEDSIDFLHIDGNHSEAISLLDAETYLPKVRSGGYICYNDCLWPERISGLNFLLRSCEVVQYINNKNCILLRKS